tara:strand:+ start:1861 stop:2421 length:561 start_codon:yes stop_codon:yes gene_type:complete
VTRLLNVGHLEPQSTIYGPGNRFVIWTQGCTLGCKGCWNKQFWPESGGKGWSIDDLAQEILATKDIEGITLLGGEPFQQLSAVRELIETVKEHGMTVFLYTGYEKKEFSEAMWETYHACDIVVTGRYRESLRSTFLQWRGSSNQEVDFPSPAYQDIRPREVRQVEFHIENGELRLYGYPTEHERAW